MNSSPTDPALVDVLMPQMGTSVFEGTLVAWLFGVGDEIVADATICEISTDKIDSECPAPASGRLAEILVEVGETVEVGTVMARIASREVSPSESAPDTLASGPPPERPTSAADRASNTNGSENRRRYSPLVKRIAAEHGIDLHLVAGSGRGGRVTKKDLFEAVRTSRQEPVLHSDSPYRPEPDPLSERSGKDPEAQENDRIGGRGGVSAPLSGSASRSGVRCSRRKRPPRRATRSSSVT